MFEVKGELWTLPADVICITTNGFVKATGECVMGRGCALEAKQLFPGIEFRLGEYINAYGNHVYRLANKNVPDGPRYDLLSFPVKHNWYEKADIDLIVRSCHELVELVDYFCDENSFIALPRPGCGNGSLEWKNVRPAIQDILDDRFGVVFK